MKAYLGEIYVMLWFVRNHG